MLLTIKILLTIATLGYSAIPGIFDSNNTHATNPSWTGHARYHVVWQVSSYIYVAVLMLCLIWIAGADTKLLWIAAITAACMYAGFWTAYASRPVYGGWLVDKVNGVPDFKGTCSAADLAPMPMSRCSRRPSSCSPRPQSCSP